MTRSLEYHRRQAKSLKKAHAAGDPRALARASRVLTTGDDPLTHASALHVVAREAGFDSWPKLKFHVETAGLDRVERAERLKNALYLGTHWMVRQLLDQTPDLADGQFGLLCALYRREQVADWLRRDPGVALRTVQGPRRPILHLAFSRHIQAHPELVPDMLAVAEALVDAGADVNDGYPAAPGSDHLLSALYGAVGHADNMELARWLLERGADPDDGESLYHATELGHHRGLKMLLEHGADPRGTNALLRAMDFHDLAAVRLLLDHGARADDFDDSIIGGEAPWVVPALHQAARRGCDREMAELLLDNGADPGRIFDGVSAYAYARVFGNPDVAGAIAARGGATALTAAETLLARAADGEDTGDARLTGDAIAPAYLNIIRTILHLPDKLDHVRRLVALGVPHDRPDSEGLTPVQIAGWEGLPEVMQYLLSLGPDLNHLNGYGGNLVTTILHGADNCPQRDRRDHVRCLLLALDAGLPLGHNAIRGTSNPAVLRSMEQWADRNPDRLVESIP